MHTPSRRADRQAVRAPLVLSASQDGQVSLIEIIENNPTEEVEVDGDRLESAYRQLRRLQTSLQDLSEKAVVQNLAPSGRKNPCFSR
ncbi:alpha/beta hydrolase [aff. Roholtiella sp. LEGE 12411]|uniref:alpha/beta hydrolase n=1 Tax=aff. Roholtiella sp. LEGE 12411 TaxID=1828822 RepID=UPI0030D806BF